MQEADRIRVVYGEYDRDPNVQRRWDPAQPGNAANRARLKESLQSLLTNVEQLRVLEIGCGSGDVLLLLKELGATEENLHGVDLREDAIAQAQARLPKASFKVANAESLDVEQGSFDMVLLFTVLSSVLADASRQRIAAEAERTLKPGGAIVWYDMRFPNPWNRNVRPISRAELDVLFPGCEKSLCGATLIPQIARRIGPFTAALFPILHAVPILRSHWLGALRKPITRC
jgi:ubiquinone/menaquinone biosynthesis C-methylase UbiE